MAVSKAQKVEILAGLTAQFKEAKSLGFASTSTLTVDEFANLRSSLREVGATYTLAKKTLIRKALKDALDIEVDLSSLEGQIGVVCSNEDAVAGLGKVNDMVKATKGEKITWAACIFDGEFKTLEETKVLAGLPSRDTLLSRLVGSMKSPVSGLARFFDAAAKDLDAKSAATVGDLKSDTPATQAPAKEEAPKAEEVKEEVAAEAPAKEVVAEAPAEETK